MLLYFNFMTSGISHGHHSLQKVYSRSSVLVDVVQLPAIESILREGSRKVKRNSINVLAICPTRELATQVAAEAKMLTTFHRDLGVQVVIGGTNMATESARLQRSPCQVSRVR